MSEEEKEKVKVKKEKVPKAPKVPKEKKPSKTCFICGDSTTDYVVFQNGYVCSKCVEKEAFIRLKQDYENNGNGKATAKT